MTEIERLPHVQRALLEWHERNGLRAPWRESRDPYHVLVAAMMAQQTQMSRVLESYERFLAAFPTLDSLASASAGAVIRVWRGMGYNTRAVRLHRAAQTIAETGWPPRGDELARIPGIGPFTAAIIASFAFGEPAACVDTNVRRVLGRLSGDEHAAPKKMQELADTSIAHDEPARWNQALMDYGARVCLTRPRCEECVVAEHCRWFRRQPHEGQRAAEPRASYDVRPKRRKAPAAAYEGSTRWYRGRIIDALRALPAGAGIAIDQLAPQIVNGVSPLTNEEVRVLADALARDGLLVVRTHDSDAIEVALPD